MANTDNEYLQIYKLMVVFFRKQLAPAARISVTVNLNHLIMLGVQNRTGWPAGQSVEFARGVRTEGSCMIESAMYFSMGFFLACARRARRCMPFITMRACG
jgi:hypothetical protein